MGSKSPALLHAFVPSPDARVQWLKITVVTAFLAGFLLSWRLWISSARSYPLTPVFSFLVPLPYPIDYGVFSLALFILLFIGVAKAPRLSLIFLFLILGLLAVEDQSRWRVWFYQYFFMLGALTIYFWKPGDEKTRRQTLFIGGLILTSIYFWSGIQKLNTVFFTRSFPWIIDPLANLFPESAQPIIHSLAFLAPLTEVGLSLGLWIPRLRNFFVLLALGMHAFILFLIGPLGHGWNTIAWPWNIALGLFAFGIFWDSPISFTDSFSDRSKVFRTYLACVVILFTLMPALSFLDYWDSYPSFTLYSGNTKMGIIQMKEHVWETLPVSVRKYAERAGPHFSLRISNWSLGELGVSSYPEERIYKNILRKLCEAAMTPDDFLLSVAQKPGIFTGITETNRYNCQGKL